MKQQEIRRKKGKMRIPPSAVTVTFLGVATTVTVINNELPQKSLWTVTISWPMVIQGVFSWSLTGRISAFYLLARNYCQLNSQKYFCVILSCLFLMLFG